MTRLPESIRFQVRLRAGKRCEYCCLPEGFGFYNHQVDHIISIRHNGSSDLNNLAWACFDCNNTKGSDIAAYDDETGQLVPLFNPRTQNGVTILAWMLLKLSGLPRSVVQPYLFSISIEMNR